MHHSTTHVVHHTSINKFNLLKSGSFVRSLSVCSPTVVFKMSPICEHKVAISDSCDNNILLQSASNINHSLLSTLATSLDLFAYTLLHMLHTLYGFKSGCLAATDQSSEVGGDHIATDEWSHGRGRPATAERWICHLQQQTSVQEASAVRVGHCVILPNFHSQQICEDHMVTPMFGIATDTVNNLELENRERVCIVEGLQRCSSFAVLWWPVRLCCCGLFANREMDMMMMMNGGSTVKSFSSLHRDQH